MIKPVLTAFVLAATAVVAQDKPTFSVTNLPDKWEEGQVGTNQCKKFGSDRADSMCQNVFLNDASDFCLWGPMKKDSVGNSEELMVSYCSKSGYGTRLIPNGAVRGAHFVKTPDFLQITGVGDFTGLDITAGDSGGELDPHGATGNGNPRGGLVFSRNVPGQEGKWVQLKEWSNFMSANEFSFRACYGSQATQFCPHIYDVMGAYWNHPGSYDAGVFENCDGQSGQYPGVYGGSTFYQSQPNTPSAHKPGASSNCRNQASVVNGPAQQLPYRKAAQGRGGASSSSSSTTVMSGAPKPSSSSSSSSAAGSAVPPPPQPTNANPAPAKPAPAGGAEDATKGKNQHHHSKGSKHAHHHKKPKNAPKPPAAPAKPAPAPASSSPAPAERPTPIAVMPLHG